MRLANITREEMTEALNRGRGERDSRVAMLLQEERAGVEIHVPEAAIRQVLELEALNPVDPDDFQTCNIHQGLAWPGRTVDIRADFP